MELNNIIGFKLTEIQKTYNLITLFFNKRGTNEKIKLSYENGLLFETTTPVINRKVTNVNLKSVLGFKAITELRNQSTNPNDFRQLLIEMEGSTSEYKIEIICVFRKHKLKRIT
ncbi:hypothetical protein VR611_06195 [Aquirufa nivalisilvae]